MEITLNNNREFIDTNKASITVSELLQFKRYSFKMLVVKVNGTLIKKEQYGSAPIHKGDNVQVIHLISGG